MTYAPEHSEPGQESQPGGDAGLVPLGQTDLAGQTTDSGTGRIFPCTRCGADLEFHIGQQQLKCPYCGAVQEIELSEDAEIREQDFHAMLDRLRTLRLESAEELPEHSEVRCESCGADVVFTGTLTSSTCPYCGSPIQREGIHTATFRVPVDAVLSFHVDRRKAQGRLSDWVRSLWFAPNDFKKSGIDGRLEGVYLPFWTFDAMSFTRYTGERGEHYTVTVGSGKDRRTERRTRWWPASGRFQRFFDDVLVSAAQNLPQHLLNRLEPWPLQLCQPFSQQFLAGCFARTYDLELEGGYAQAKERMERAIYRQVCMRIGGDEQRVHSIQTRYDAITFKHILLPVWMLAYHYKQKPYRVMINAVTGEVQGERPWSWVKIFFAVLSVALLAAAVYAFAQR